MPEFLEQLSPAEKVDPSKVHGLEEYADWDKERITADGRAKKALEIAMQSGSVDGDYHKAWAIDQMVRALTGSPVAYFRNNSAVGGPIIVAGLGESDEYRKFVNEHNNGEDGPNTYSWEEGIAP